MTDIVSYDTEVECLAALVAQARPGDVVGLMCHAEREEGYAWIAGTAAPPTHPNPDRQGPRAAA